MIWLLSVNWNLTSSKKFFDKNLRKVWGEYRLIDLLVQSSKIGEWLVVKKILGGVIIGAN